MAQAALLLQDENTEQATVAVKKYFNHVGLDGYPETVEMTEGTRILNVRRGTIAELEEMYQSRALGTGFNEERIRHSLEENQIPFDIVETTILPEVYPDGSKPTYPERAINVRLCPRMR